MSRVSIWLITVCTTSMILAGCGDGFQAKIRPGSEIYGSTGGVCCGAPPSSAPRANLVDNSSFEADFAGWEDWGSSSISGLAAHSGGKGLRVISTGGRGQEVIYRLKTGATYVLKSYARVASLSDVVYVGIRYFDTGNATIGDERVRVNTLTFSEYTVRFQVPLSVSSAKVYVYKENGSSTPADFDDFALAMVEAPVNPPMRASIANPSNLQPSGPGTGWTMVLNEQFDSPSLSSSIWNIGYWFTYTINNELQAYRPENVKVGTGTMSLLGEKRATTTTWGEAMNYASGAVTTRNKFTFTFGVAEARIRVPKGRGFHPAFWLLPNNKRSPPQINVLDIFGNDPTTNHMNYLYMDDNGIGRGQPMVSRLADFSAGFHVFTLQWLPESLSYYIDGQLVGIYKGDFVLRDPAYMILNLAIGGDGVSSPDASTVFPQSFDVEYVRVWQKPL